MTILTHAGPEVLKCLYFPLVAEFGSKLSMIIDTEPSAERNSADPEYSTQQLSAYYLELEQLLGRVENSVTHYQALGLNTLSTSGEIKLAYLRAAALLNPSQFGLNLSIPDGSLPRVDEAFEKISCAFAMLVSASRKRRYDESLRPNRTEATLSIKSESEFSDSPPEASSHKAGGAPVLTYEKRDAINTNYPAPLPEALSAPAGAAPDGDRRKCERFKLSIPVLVTGYERGKGKWTEIAQTLDVSRTGVRLRLTKRVRNGRVLHLMMPMPAELRTHQRDEPGYGVYAVVQRVDPIKNSRRSVGLELLGEDPPAGYLEEPTETFDDKNEDGVQRRRSEREERVEEVTIDYLSQTMQLLAQETTFTENVSSTGMRVMIENAPADFELVRVRRSKRGFESLAAVSSQYVGHDGVERLCLRFLDDK